MQSKTEKGRNIMNLKSSANQKKKSEKKKFIALFLGILNKVVVRVMRGLEAKKSRDTTRRLFNRERTYQENTRREIVHKERIVQH